MTPLQVILLAKKMRDAQKRYFKSRDNIIDCKALEKEFDDAIEPYISYARSYQEDGQNGD